ncbi:MAG: CPBP family intramembrane metalloprotease [archaeon]|nr:CPBP family intramembrane metalloprotease [archaeon]
MQEFLATNIIFDALLLLAPIAFIYFFEKRRPRQIDFGLVKASPIDDAILAGKIFLAILIYSMLISFALYSLGVNDFAGVENAIRAVAQTNMLALAYLMVFRVFAEEFFFRAFLVPRIGILGSSILFGLLHLGYGSVSEIIGAILLGGILAISYKQYGRILPNFLAHFLYNFVALAVIFGG